MFALVPLLRHLIVIVVTSVFLFFFSIGQAIIYSIIIFGAIALGILIYYIVKKDNHIRKRTAFIFAICVSSYLLISFLSHSLFVNNQDIEFLKDILTGIELPLALTIVSEASTASNPKNDKLLADVNDKITKLLTIVNNKNTDNSTKVNDENIELLTKLCNRNAETLTKVNDKITVLLTENKPRKTVQTRRLLQVKKLHKNNRLTNIK